MLTLHWPWIPNDRENDMLSESTIFGNRQKKEKKRRINRLLILKVISLWGKHLVVATPSWSPNDKSSQAPGYKSKIAFDCIFNQHWFLGSLDDHDSMCGPWLNISNMCDKLVEVISWSPFLLLGIQSWFLSGMFTEQLLIKQTTPDIQKRVRISTCLDTVTVRIKCF